MNISNQQYIIYYTKLLMDSDAVDLYLQSGVKEAQEVSLFC